VCGDCNGHFGRTIELTLGRDSLEASLRLIHGTKPAEEYHELGNKRTRMTLAHPDPARQGSPLTWREEDGVPVASHIPQVRFLARDGRGWVSVTEPELEDLDRPLPPEVEQPPKHMRIVGRTEEDRQRLRVTLVRRGVSFEKVT
jgi:hypothetical protein